MKKIGFIDLFLDEWHANNYPAWIRETGRDFAVSYAWAKMAAPSGLDTEGWCRQYEAQQLDTIEAVVEKSDYLIVLSPDNPEYHEELCRIPLQSGKPVYVDKTFSPDLASGARMFALAERRGTPMFSSSALRYARELAAYPNEQVNRGTLETVATFGPGQFGNYAVHQLEMSVSLFGPGARRVKSLSGNHSRLLVIEYPGGQRALLTQMAEMPFHLSLQMKNGEGCFIPQCSDIFPRLIDAILDFFETGKPPVPKEETLEIMALLDAGRKVLEKEDCWIEVEKA
ncbi:MAG: oxidoreductase [Chloroflexi bacterium]|nr:MAG: oxidoreductase [Chloroflexota bacterium]